MVKIKDYIRNLIVKDSSYSEEESNKRNVVVLQALSLQGDNEVTESLEERIDTILSRFNLDLGNIDEEQMVQAFNLLHDINLGVEKLSDDEFLNKLDVVSQILETHGIVGIERISKDDLVKLKEFYKAFVGGSLEQVTIESFEKVNGLDFDAIKQIQDISDAELSAFIKFMNNMGIDAGQDAKTFKATEHLTSVLQRLGYYRGNNWLEQKEKTKIEYLLQELNMQQISLFSESKVEDLVYIFNEFNVNFASTTYLEIRRSLKNLKQLGLLAGQDSQVLRAKMEIITKLISNPSKMTQSEISKVVNLMNLMGTSYRNAAEIEEIFNWLKVHEVHFSETDLKTLITQIDHINTSFEKACGITLAHASVGVLKGVNQVLETYAMPALEKIEATQVDVVGKKLTKLKLSEGNSDSQEFKLATFRALKDKCVKGITDDLPEAIDKALEKGVQEIGVYFKCKIDQAGVTLPECKTIDTTKTLSEADYVANICGDVSGEL